MKLLDNVTCRTLLRNSALGTIAFASGVDNIFGQKGVRSSEHRFHHG
jgi:hypothetical protein